jgi:hypothetical protein
MHLLEPLTFRPGALDRAMPLSLLLARHKAVRLKRLAASTTPTHFETANSRVILRSFR